MSKTHPTQSDKNHNEAAQLTEVRRRYVRLLAQAKAIVDDAPCDEATDLALGGPHRVWIRKCAMEIATDALFNARTIQRDVQAEAEATGRKIRGTTGLRGADGSWTSRAMRPIRFNFPMPPHWNGVRPQECSTYGHSASRYKDDKHFTHTLTYALADQGYIVRLEAKNLREEPHTFCFTICSLLDAAWFGFNPDIQNDDPIQDVDWSGRLPPYPETDRPFRGLMDTLALLVSETSDDPQ
jgi:hypothetical protein